MFFRMITASLMRRRSRMLVALLAIAIGATILSGLVTIYYDVPRQMGAQFRNYGANILFTPSENSFSAEDLEAGLALADEGALVGSAPYRYESVRIHEQPVMAAGTNMEGVQKTSPYWLVEGEWPSASGEVMIGKNVADNLQLKNGSTFSMVYTGEDSEETPAESGAESAADGVESAADGVESAAEEAESPAAGPADGSGGEEDAEEDDYREAEFTVTAVLSTGGPEENYVYISMEDLESLTEISGKIDLAEVSMSAGAEELNAYTEKVSGEVPAVRAQLVKRVTASETTVLSKLQALVLLVTIVVLALTMICVATTMTAVVAERRREIGLRKAIGASDGSIIREFMGEGMLLGFLGGIIGAFLGFAFAQTVSMKVFSSSITFQPLLVPVTIIVSIAITGLACLLPIRSATKVDPALVLKGE